MITLSLNTSITSTHKNDFYSTTGEYWIKVNNVHGNYFSDSACPGGNPMDFYVRIAESGVWKYIGGCNDFNYYYPLCYQYCKWDFINVRYYNFNNENDPDNRKYIDKIAVTYLGMRNESFVNRCNVNITTVDNNDIPLPGVKILDSNIPTINDSNFLAFTSENGGEKVCTPLCRDPDTTSIGTELRTCDTEVSLMQTQKQNDCILIETEGIPTKLTFTISTPGIYTGSLHYQYWNGTDWTYFPESDVIDKTNGFRNSGTKDVTLPIVSDWKKRTWYAPSLLYMCRVIFDSGLSVTTPPKASCLRWSGSYETITNSSGTFNFQILSSGINTINVPGTLAEYIPLSGNGQIQIPEASSNKDIKVILVKSDLSNNLTCPTTVYKNQTKDILITSTVSNGGISNTLTISSPKTDSTIFNPSSGIDVPISYTFTEETLYKIQLKSEDAGKNVVGKTCYVNVTAFTDKCDILTDQLSCESNGCFWTGNKCISSDPHIELSDIYQSIIDKIDCISNECISTLDLDNDGIITNNDKELSLILTYNETISKILSYQICKELNPCKETKSSIQSSVIIGGATLGLIYLYSKTRKK